jgi:raffinose/stachyose/melibiose transport system substrate-binding protein
VRNSTRRRLAALGLIVLVACATASVAASRPLAKQDTTIKMAMSTTYKPGFDILIANFGRVFPDIKVEPTYYVAGAPFATAVTTQFAAGNGSDVVWTTGARTGPTSVWPFAEAGYLADLSKSPWVKRLFTGTKGQYTYKNKVYSWDFGLSALALLSYNKDFFQQNSLKIPTTFSGLLSLCRRISGLGKIPIAWAGASQAVNTNNVVSLAGNTLLSSDPKWLQKRTAKTTTFASTNGWRRALQQVMDMKNAGCFSPGVAGVPLPQMLSQFASGQAAMMFTYAGLNGQVLQQSPTLKVGMFAPPGDTAASTRLTAQAAGGVAIWSKSPNKQAAQTFVNFLAREKQSRLFAKINYLISPFDALKGNLPTAYADLAPWFKSNKVIPTITAEWPNTQFGTVVGASIQGLFTGQKTIDDVLKDMDTAFALP